MTSLLGKPDQKPYEYLIWEFHGYGGQQAVRMGKWKAVRRNCGRDPEGPIELYDLETDVNETTDLAGKHPEMVRRMAEILVAEHVPSPH